ncbi:calcium-activated chloride channel regulator 1-like [Liolophura sinensis]|uniref:calcium-activated chloride channel regulator 1-like n=1 Tax=Liolophura sinensis TaxID=3198878 RepID=UPI003158FEF0
MIRATGSHCGYTNKCAFVVIVLVASIGHWPVTEACGRGSIYLKNNGYRQILIAIGNNVTEDISLLNRIQDVFAKASTFLYQITKKRAFFEEIIVLVPKSWSNRREYASATNQTIDVSDIVIDSTTDQDRQQRHKPFVIRSSPCGKPGEYMQLTPEYLKNGTIAGQYGTYEKVIVHEWAHLRYGVFDEYPDGFLSPEFYAAQNGEIEGTRCSTALRGEFYDYLKGNGLCDFKNGLPYEFCQFKDEQEVSGKYGSLMYSHKLDHVVGFCDNDTNSPNTLHNRQAPTTQNRNCDGKSVWEVLRSHPDFAEGANLPRDVPSTEPTFRFVKHSSKRTVIVLDTSGSMTHNHKLYKLAQAVKNYILNVAVEGDQIGIVWFSSKATIKAYLTAVKNSTRDQLVAQIPKSAYGATSIGDGLRKAMAVLSRDGQDPAGGVILLVSDGKENRPPWLANVRNQVISSNVIVDTIAITEEADQKIEVLAKVTQGSSYFFSDKGDSNALNEAFIALGERGTGILDRPIQLSSQSVTIKGNNSYQENIVIDSTIGKKTEFLIGHSTHVIIIEVTTPSGRKISRNDSECITDLEFKETRIKIPGVAEKGRWKLFIRNPNQIEQPVTITVTSGVTDRSGPIVTTATWAKKTVQFPDDRQILYVSVSQGLSPVLQANVEAILERPNAAGETAPSIQLALRDNGAGGDTSKDDGIYSSYVTNFTDNGRYHVKVKVNDSPVSVVMKDKIVGAGGSGAAGRNRERRNTGSRQHTENFQRVTSAGSFRLENFTAGVDAFPPGKVTDLRVSVDDGTEEVTLSWTATGADLDQGTASSYVLWKSKDFNTIYTNHRGASRIEVDIKPQTAGTEEMYTIYVEETGSVTYFFALEAVDNSGNISPRSNVASVSLKYLNPPLNLPLIAGFVSLGLVLLVLVSAGSIIIYKQHKRREQPNKGEKYQQNVKEHQMKY